MIRIRNFEINPGVALLIMAIGMYALAKGMWLLGLLFLFGAPALAIAKAHLDGKLFGVPRVYRGLIRVPPHPGEGVDLAKGEFQSLDELVIERAREATGRVSYGYGVHAEVTVRIPEQEPQEFEFEQVGAQR